MNNKLKQLHKQMKQAKSRHNSKFLSIFVDVIKFSNRPIVCFIRLNSEYWYWILML